MEKEKDSIDLENKTISFIEAEKKNCIEDILRLEEAVKNYYLEKEKVLREEEQMKAGGLNNADFLNPASAKIRSAIYDMNVKSKLLQEKIEKCNIELSEKMGKIQHYENILSFYRESNKESEVKLTKSKQEQKAKELRILENYESERKRIARDLHDSTIQNLINLMHKVELCSKIVDSDIIRVKLELAGMNHSIKSTIDEMREIIYNLRPMAVDDLGIITAVEQYIEQMKYIHQNVEMQLDVEGREDRKSSILNVTLFRIIQEACQNVFKYAKATIIIITLKFKEDKIILTIEDDGIGFDMKEVGENPTKDVNSGFGLINMRERVGLLQGEFNLRTGKEQGTLVEVSIPT